MTSDDALTWIVSICIVIVISELLALVAIGLNEVLAWMT